MSIGGSNRFNISALASRNFIGKSHSLSSIFFVLDSCRASRPTARLQTHVGKETCDVNPDSLVFAKCFYIFPCRHLLPSPKLRSRFHNPASRFFVTLFSPSSFFPHFLKCFLFLYGPSFFVKSLRQTPSSISAFKFALQFLSSFFWSRLWHSLLPENTRHI